MPLTPLSREFDADSISAIQAVAQYTMTPPQRIVALRDAVAYLVGAGIPGAFVECDVWRGGSVMVAANELLRLGCRLSQRAPTLRRGAVEETLPERHPEQVALLRLDTDFYESTRAELEHLYPRLQPGGILILDDYGYWQGAKHRGRRVLRRPVAVNPVGPRGVYDEAKRFGEAMTMAYRRSRDVDTTIVRIFNTFGERMRPDDGRAIPTFICQRCAASHSPCTATDLRPAPSATSKTWCAAFSGCWTLITLAR